MFTTVISAVAHRYRGFLASLSFSVKVGISGICSQLAFGLICDSWPSWNAVALSFIVWVMMVIMAIEAAALLEFRAVQLFDYSTSKSNPERDRVIGKFALRILLLIGNIALAVSLYKDFFHKFL